MQNFMLLVLNNTVSQHNHDTQLIDIGTDGTSAHVITYYTGSCFGTGAEKAGKTLTPDG